MSQKNHTVIHIPIVFKVWSSVSFHSSIISMLLIMVIRFGLVCLHASNGCEMAQVRKNVSKGKHIML